MIIAIDGVSASGKGYIARTLAKKIQFAYLDTGLLYRAVAYIVKEKNIQDNIDEIIKVANNLTLADTHNNQLMSDEIANIAAKIANIQEVRQALLTLQVDFANNPSKYQSDAKGAILDGRDIGTVVCPTAKVKFYITSSLKVRAKRRLLQLQNKGIQASYDDLLLSLEKRDENDKNRAIGALKKAEDAIEIDNTNLSREETNALIYNYVAKFLSS